MRHKRLPLSKDTLTSTHPVHMTLVFISFLQVSQYLLHMSRQKAAGGNVILDACLHLFVGTWWWTVYHGEAESKKLKAVTLFQKL